MGTITINSNVASLNAERRLAISTRGVEQSFARLSSGLRINRAVDDAAGLSVASALNTDRRVFNQGVRNLNDGLSLLNIADSALVELSTIMVRLSELAEQAANGTLGNRQRQALDGEAQSLKDEYFRIVKTTEFNGVKLFEAGNGTTRFQAGYGQTGGIAASLGGKIGSGSFQTRLSYAAAGSSNQHFAVQLGDLNGDGALDLVTAGGNSGASLGFVTVRLGDGSGSFGAARSYSSENGRSRGLALGDVNGDGILDVVTSGYTGAFTGFTTVRLGNGDGSFGARVSYAAETGTSNAVMLEDINGDDTLDLITAGSSSAGAGYATIRLGSGQGTFGARLSYATEELNSTSVGLGDVNLDGTLDLITAGQATGGGYATMRLGDGSGTFGTAVSYTTESDNSRALRVVDLNRDGTLDLLTAGESNPFAGYATVRLGTANGTFGAAVSYTMEARASLAITAGDVNGDGALDLVSAGYIGAINGYTTVRLGDGRGTFGAALSFAMDASFSRAVTLGDIDNDGVLDMVTAGNAGTTPYASVRLATTLGGVAPLLDFSIGTLADARQALPTFKNKLSALASQRGIIGALQTRVETAINTTTVASENFSSAASQITDSDVAEESAQLIKQRILQQAGVAVLGQANQAPALALALLQ